MQISVEKRDGLEHCMTVELPAEGFEQAVENRLANLARTVKMPGFRPGKVPLRIVKSQYGAQAKQEALEEAVQSSLYEALSKENLRPAGAPSVEFLPLEEGKGPKYTVTFEVMPEIELADMSGTKIEIPVAEITEEDVDKTIERIRGQRQEWKEVERAAKDGDQVIVDFVGTKDGVAFEGGTGSKVPLVIGSGRFISDFEKGVEGAKAGDVRNIDATFPEDYGNKELAGQTVQFEVTVGSVMEAVLPEINDDFVKELGVEEGTVEALRAQVRENMERELRGVLREVTKTNVMDALLEKNKIDLPQVMVKQEMENLVQQMQNMLAQQGVPMPKDRPMDPELYRDQAERRVSLGLLMSELIGKEGIVASDEKVREAVEEIAAPYENPQEIIDHYYGDQNRLAEVQAVVMEQAVVDWVLEKAEKVENKTNFDEIMQSSRG
jgi:trigger factor